MKAKHANIFQSRSELSSNNVTTPQDNWVSM